MALMAGEEMLAIPDLHWSLTIANETFFVLHCADMLTACGTTAMFILSFSVHHAPPEISAAAVSMICEFDYCDK